MQFLVQERRDAATAGPLPEDGKIIRCAKGTEGWTYTDGKYSLSFELPWTSDVIYLYGRGMRSAGSVYVIQDESISDAIHVDVVAAHPTPAYLQYLAVCSMESQPGERGVGIFVRPSPRSLAYT